MANLSQKETMLLKDLKSHEDWCIRKYTNAANQAQDPQLKQVFTDLANQERQHLNTLHQIERGEPVLTGQGGQSQSQYNFEMANLGQTSTNQKQQVQQANQQYKAETGQVGQTQPSNNPFTRSYQQQSQSTPVSPAAQPQAMKQSPGTANQTDVDLCFDLLNTEKYVSSTYNTAIFEFTDHSHRAALNHIQKEEQEHGEKIYNYLKSKGAYPVQ